MTTGYNTMTSFEIHRCRAEECLVMIECTPYKITYCVDCGKIYEVIYPNMNSNEFIDKYKNLKMFVLN